ncbi:hypothetical protein [Anthocerotibacter panamensis]|uniref:hypothetical protein n=1 Tax=Anthocerotibacter panamensis TaxID=2857077 RepID=UPI001C40771C|nr:hypothetical protein [Anthocerotibacter panamensis]
MNFSHQQRIIALWIVFLFGTVFHTQLALMPLLYGQSVAMAGAQGVMPEVHFWLMLGFFTLPMTAIAAVLFSEARPLRVAHLGLTVFYSAMNLVHVVSDLLVQPIVWAQIALMLLVLGNGVLLNLSALRWYEAGARKPWRAL